MVRLGLTTHVTTTIKEQKYSIMLESAFEYFWTMLPEAFEECQLVFAWRSPARHAKSRVGRSSAWVGGMQGDVIVFQKFGPWIKINVG